MSPFTWIATSVSTRGAVSYWPAVPVRNSSAPVFGSLSVTVAACAENVRASAAIAKSSAAATPPMNALQTRSRKSPTSAVGCWRDSVRSIFVPLSLPRRCGHVHFARARGRSRARIGEGERSIRAEKWRRHGTLDSARRQVQICAIAHNKRGEKMTIDARRRHLVLGSAAAGSQALIPGLAWAQFARLDTLPTVDSLTVRVLTDSSYDTPKVDSNKWVKIKRPPPLTSRKALHNQWGLALALESRIGTETRHVLLDSGLTSAALLNNMDYLGVDPARFQP